MASRNARTPPPTNANQVIRGKARKVPNGQAAMTRLRKDWGMTTQDFVRITGYPEREVASWEAGSPVGPPAARRLAETQRLLRSLGELVQENTIPTWLRTPNKAFDGLMPLEVIERGDFKQLWRMIYYLESGIPT